MKQTPPRATPVETVRLPVGPLTFTVDVAGPEGGELVLLLHGFPQNRHSWRRELAVLSEQGYRACAPDQRGYSPDARPRDIAAYRLENLVEDALSVASALGYERFHLVGHDWGGAVAWTTAALYPARVRTLSVISRPHPQAFLRALEEDPAQSNRSAHHRNNQRPEATREALADNGVRMRDAMMREGVPAEDVDAYLGPLLEHAALDAAINWYRAMGRSTIRARDIPAVTMPTLYVWGTRDGTVGRLAAETTKDFVHAPYRFVELEDVGHFVTDQVPDVFPPLLIEHLTRMDRA